MFKGVIHSKEHTSLALASMLGRKTHDSSSLACVLASPVQLEAGRDRGNAPSREVRPKTDYRSVTNPEESHPSASLSSRHGRQCQQLSVHDPNSCSVPSSPVPATRPSSTRSPRMCHWEDGVTSCLESAEGCSALLGLRASSPEGHKSFPSLAPLCQCPHHFTVTVLLFVAMCIAVLTAH